MERIAIVSEDISRPVDEGFKKATVRLAAAIKSLVPETGVFTRQPGNAALEAEALPANKMLWGAAFSRTLRSFGPDVILYVPEAAATPMSIVRAASLRKQSAGKPVALLSLQRRTYPPLLGPVLRSLRPDLMLVLSRAGLESVAHLGVKTVRVPLGVDSGVFHPPEAGARERLRAKYRLPEARMVLHVGHISPGRNLQVLARIAGEATKVLVVSSTTTRRHPDVEAMLKSRDFLLLDTYIEQIEEIYRLVDGYVFPTVSATDAIDIPLSVLEAMASNLPVATTAFGGIPDLFTAGEGLHICATEEELVEAAAGMIEGEAVATREKVLGLSWNHAAESILEAIAAEVL